MKKTVYAGTYTGNGSEGIYRFDFEDGILSDPQLFCRIKNPKYICLQNDVLTAVCDNEKRSGAALVNMEGEITDTISYEGGTSCYVCRDENRIYTANYHEGCFTALREENGRLVMDGIVQIREKAGTHQVIPFKDQLLVPCLLLDRVMIYDRDLNRTGSIRFNNGTGPRHGVITKDGQYLYLVSELSNELFVITTADWQIQESISILPNGEKYKRDSAAIRLSEDEKHVYISTRTMDIISVVRMEDHHPQLIQTVSCGGRHPRDFILLDGYLLSANRFSNTVVSFKINEDGTIGEEVSRISVPEAVSLAVR